MGPSRHPGPAAQLPPDRGLAAEVCQPPAGEAKVRVVCVHAHIPKHKLLCRYYSLLGLNAPKCWMLCSPLEAL
eukprot:1158916-Pelagomonas_calceolata.AAC.7